MGLDITNNLYLKTTISVLPVLLAFGCNNPKKKPVEYVVIANNITSVLSEDSSELSKWIDLKTFKPIRVKFKLTIIDNSGDKERMAVPGPSDRELEAQLVFDRSGMAGLK